MRRVVTGHGPDGRSRVLYDEQAGPGDPAAYVPERNPGTCLIDLWSLAGLPTRFDTAPPGPSERFALNPPAGGLVFRTVELPPDSERDFSAFATYFEGMGGKGNLAHENARHPAMHKTDTVDLAIILQGEVVLILDEGEVSLRPGDVVVQRGTNHAWSNRSDAPCIFACVLIDATGNRHKDAASA
jgi:mannose-6-phosphate isomerase-like protein (cupin superfamily)